MGPLGTISTIGRMGMLVITGRRTASKLSLAITAEHSQFGVAILSNGGTMLALLSWPLVFEAHSVGRIAYCFNGVLGQNWE
ncbi:hypothetical protein N7522_004039 [Penicillium canescens]|uniref:Uncharacterized protein n=1 Tax=Penicillium canescens TaxID=5083 RepID=A0AAD6IJU3_PENCN|nr:uncharacterized protein N7446_005569 [Penicillium canescens]KAJ6009023.1 hypothetical protein N7522_004039 [Penicillium canescens]KAJ6050193.1 hypothetical protein N7444_006909 [Penicillium canescens]KAJ6050941.1 hypothetical protein N7460_001475 [Penicillium canescens]KAJ6061449.1 hypothetical protein N7446_005569 [Penicillium canescens]